MLGIGGRKDHQRLFRQAVYEFQAGDVGHFDIEEDQVDRMLLQIVQSFERVGEAPGQFEVGHFGRVRTHYRQGHGFVVDGYRPHLSIFLDK